MRKVFVIVLIAIFVIGMIGAVEASKVSQQEKKVEKQLLKYDKQLQKQPAFKMNAKKKLLIKKVKTCYGKLPAYSQKKFLKKFRNHIVIDALNEHYYGC